MIEECKGIITALVAFVVLVAFLCLICDIGEKKANSRQYTIENRSMSEWISPDGVHYWIGQGGNRGYFAPRYDSNGNLVID